MKGRIVDLCGGLPLKPHEQDRTREEARMRRTSRSTALFGPPGLVQRHRETEVSRLVPYRSGGGSRGAEACRGGEAVEAEVRRRRFVEGVGVEEEGEAGEKKTAEI